MIRIAEAWIPTGSAKFRMITYSNGETDSMPHIALVHEELDASRPVLVRIHSECMTGDLFHSTRCDCGEQLNISMSMIAAQKGLLIYLRQEGRGIGLANKLKAYNLQDMGADTYKANEELGFHPDERNYADALEIIKDLGIREVILLTNNPEKISAFDDSGIHIIDRKPVITKPHPENVLYLEAKKSKGHLL